MKVLIAEEESIIALDLKTTLAANSYSVIDTVRTFKGVELNIKENRPDVLITSISLNKKDDYFDKIISLQKEYNFYVLCLSASADFSKYRSKCNSDYFSFLKKPFDSKALLNLIEPFRLKIDLKTK